MVDIVIDGKYRLGRYLDKGLFSEIFQGHMIHSGDARVAIKLELKESQFPQLDFEAKILEKLRCTNGVPISYHFGESSDYKALVMQRLGSNFKTLLDKCEGRFSLKTVLGIAERMILILE